MSENGETGSRQQRRALEREIAKGKVDIVLFPKPTVAMLEELLAQKQILNQRIADVTRGACSALGIDLKADNWKLMDDGAGIERMNATPPTPPEPPAPTPPAAPPSPPPASN